MAVYDYRCTSCNHVFEVSHGMTEHPDVSCPKCGKPASKVFSANGIKFDGSGFYNTDMKNSSTSSSPVSGSSSSSCENCPHNKD